MCLSLVRSVAVFLGAFAAALSAAAAQQTPTQDPRNGAVVVLRNGQIVEGRVSQEDGYCVIDFADGEIRLKNVEVEMVCRTWKKPTSGNGP